jgi:predicted porin
MKSKLLALAAVVSAGAAQAQSNVTIYGIADVYGQYLDGAARDARLQSGGLSGGSRLGFRGSEDLDAGMKAIFTLEMGLNIDDGTLGQGGAIFGRQAFVGISSPWGEVTIGRQLGSLFQLGATYLPFRIGGAGPSVTTIGGFAGGYEPFRGATSAVGAPMRSATGNGGPARIDNSIRYASPTWAGLQGTAIVGLGEVAGYNTDNRIVDLSLRYTAGPFDAYALYVSDKTSLAGNASHVDTSGLAATYRIGSYKIYAGGVNVNDKRPANEDGKGYWVGADYTWGRNVVRGEWLRSKPSDGSDNNTTAFGVGYQYNMSKRTALYTSLTRFNNGGNAGVGGLGRFNSPLPANVTRVGDNNLSEFVAGVQHTF